MAVGFCLGTCSQAKGYSHSIRDEASIRMKVFSRFYFCTSKQKCLRATIIETFIRSTLKRVMKIESTNIRPELLKQLKSYVYDILGCCQDVHKELGPWLNEYMYQEALKVAFQEKQIPFVKEYYFQVTYHGVPLEHRHFMDFLCKGNVAVECKAITSLGVEQRQQLWNYMRLTNTPIGILYNFAPVKDQCEKYYYDVKTKTISVF